MTVDDCVGKVVRDISIDGAIRVYFDDGTRLDIIDKGQQCCESRFITTDDDLEYGSGKLFLGFELKDCTGTSDDWGETHDIQFLEIKLSDCSLVFQSHNCHNGYYGGFWITCKVSRWKPEKSS
jgi:hypothetical protein